MLLEHLLDDGGRQNAIVAYLALTWSGAENIRQLVKELTSRDWQQAALIQCAASFHDVEWSPSVDAIREKWLERAGQKSGMERKFAMTALYLDPRRTQFLQGKEIPEALGRMFQAGGNVRGLAERMKWAASWFPILDPEQDCYWLFSFLFVGRW